MSQDFQPFEARLAARLMITDVSDDGEFAIIQGELLPDRAVGPAEEWSYGTFTMKVPAEYVWGPRPRKENA